MKKVPDPIESARKLFEEEYTKLESFESILNDKTVPREKLESIFLMLINEHRKLLKDAVKITIISDKIDKKLLNSNDKLKEAQQKIVALEKKQSAHAMAITASHELNQPLTVLSGNLELFQRSFPEDSLSERQKKYLSRIANSLNGIQEILEKYQETKNIHFEEYSDQHEMVIFEDD